ncbi:MAG: OmpH family outer membrane protein [Pseudomonadota bacterium]
MHRRAALAGLSAALLWGAAGAQDAESPVLVLDPERLFEQSVWGQQALARIEAESAALVAENRRIEAELIAEERALTEQRLTLSVEEFRALADTFDEKVQRLRAEQDAKTREVQSLREEEQERFFALIAPILSDLVRSRGATVVLDRRSVFLAASAADITEEAIAAVDAQLGQTTPEPESGD